MQGRSLVALVGLGVAVASLTAFGTAAGGGGAAAENDYERLLHRHAGAVVTVKYVSKISFGEGDFEDEDEFYGLMIDPSGLVLCSSSQMGLGDIGAQTIPKDIKVLAGDDTEGLAARVLARDSELDLIWIRITEAGDRRFEAVNLNLAATPRLGDRILSIERKSDFYDRGIVVSEDRIGGVFRKPRDLYAPSRGLFSDVGMPVFMVDGGLVGIFVTHAPETSHLDAGESNWNDTEYLILPAGTLAKATAQALKSDSATSRPVGGDDEEEEE